MGIRNALTGFAAFALAASYGCKNDKAPTEKTPATAPVATGKTTQTPAKKTPILNAKVVGLDRSPSGIKWIKDDFAAAMAKAKEGNKPVVVDMWAKWCHTCLSMKSTVLKDAGLAGHAERFVWAALETDKKVNAAAMEKLPVKVWPTFFVVAPDGQIAGRFVGSASVKQFREFLDQGERTARAGASLEKGSVDWHLREGDRHAAANEMKKAAVAYGAALAAAPKDWPRRPDILVAQIGALYNAGDKKACAELGKKSILETVASKSASTSDFAYYAMTCAKGLDDKKTSRAVLDGAMVAINLVLGSEDSNLAADDRSDALRILREVYIAEGKEAKAKETAREQKKVLDEATVAAASPFFAMTYNWPRSEVYHYLGEAEKLIEPLKKSAADLPKEYDPPYRLAWILHKLERNDEALVEINKAEELSYGIRKGRVLTLKAAIIAAGGDKAKTLEARKAVLAHYEALPAGQRSERAIEAAKKALEE